MAAAAEGKKMMIMRRFLAGILGCGLAVLTACPGSPNLAGEHDAGPSDSADAYVPDSRDVTLPDGLVEGWLPDGWVADSTEPWVPPVGDAGDTGWRDSTEPWVPPVVRPVGFWNCGCGPLDVWSDATGVYVLYGWEDVSVSGDPYGPWGCGGGPEHRAIWRNEGSGWTEYFRQDQWLGEYGLEGTVFSATFLGGVLDSHLLGWQHGGGVDGFQPGLVEPLWPDLDDLGCDVFVVNGALAYAVWGDKVVHWNGSVWSPLPVDVPFASSRMRVWADEHELFLAGPAATVVSLETGGWRVHDPGVLSDLTAIWGFGGDDVWVGSSVGQLLHFDGSSWTPIAWPNAEDDSECDRRSPITQMWGADGVLYFVTRSQFARWDGSRVDVLAHWPGTFVDDRWCSGGMVPFALWGNSPTEVFLAVADLSGFVPRESSGEIECCPDLICGGRVAVMRWDGTALHRF
jgi:hypothetical protein